MAAKVVSILVTDKGLMEILFAENPDDQDNYGTIEQQVSDMLRPHVKKYGFIPADWSREQVEQEFAKAEEDDK